MTLCRVCVYVYVDLGEYVCANNDDFVNVYVYVNICVCGYGCGCGCGCKFMVHECVSSVC
jgi:hypothetical protein